jgi:hypothetical protein
MKKIIIEDRQFIEELERLQNDVHSRKFIITHILTSDIEINSDNFNMYQEEYSKYYNLYEKKKSEVEKLYVKPNYPKAKSWNLDFNSGELEIYE